MIHVKLEGDEVILSFKKKRWVLPKEDCMLLPIVNTTAEEIAGWIAAQMRSKLYPKIGDRLKWIEIGVDENNGQWGYCRLPWTSD